MKSRRLPSSSQAESVENSSFGRSAANDHPTTPGAALACFLILWLCAKKAGRVRTDLRKNREVKPRYSRSGSMSPICFQGGGGGNIDRLPSRSSNRTDRHVRGERNREGRCSVACFPRPMCVLATVSAEAI